ncbi:diguanylate cyclase [Aestuariibacter sp. AA17]|uniref:diguanylate cyclase n=1 Tax=Fluctibacter corallii TaxID=2984329 RepID=A0ABT3A6N5_9ALTE|nr:diguanylate cyclase [Aestuariibacter sp. AA17]MCV2884358.1 diguanylate cyclase [Aestuariibacter sp. AA17]
MSHPLPPFERALPIASGVLLFALLALLFVSISVVLVDDVFETQHISAKKGQLTLSESMFSNYHTIPLKGEWEFHWGETLTPESYHIYQERLYTAVPHSWEKSTYGDQPIPQYGVASYVLHVNLPDSPAEYGMLLPQIGNSYRLFVDNQEIASAGKVGATADTSEPAYRAGVVTFKASTQARIILQVANFDYYWGGIWHNIHFGKRSDIERKNLFGVLRSTIIVSSFLILAIINLIHYSLRPSVLLPFVIALSCLLLGGRELEDSQLLGRIGYHDIDWHTHARASFLTFILATATLTASFHLMFKDSFQRWVMLAIYAFCTFFALLTVFFEPLFASQYMYIFQFGVLIGIVYVLARLMVNVRKRQRAAGILLVGTLFLFVLVANDILYNLGWVKTGHTVSFGLLAFVLCQLYVTYTKFIHATEENQTLYTVLETRNRALEELSQNLEAKVEKRTEELASANKKLKNLANQDPLTSLPNRRGLLQYINEFMSGNLYTATPMTLLVLDFDNFKQLNDVHGHDAGDKVLLMGAQLMRAALRKSDSIARWGGEEFLIFLPDTTLEGAKILADKLNQLAQNELSERINIPVTVTIGIAEFRLGETFDECFKRADDALYQGKSAGRNTVVLAKSALR